MGLNGSQKNHTAFKLLNSNVYADYVGQKPYVDGSVMLIYAEMYGIPHFLPVCV